MILGLAVLGLVVLVKRRRRQNFLAAKAREKVEEGEGEGA